MSEVGFLVAVPDVVLAPGIGRVWSAQVDLYRKHVPAGTVHVGAGRPGPTLAGVPGSRPRSAASGHESCDQRSLTQALACAIKHYGCVVQFFSVRWHIENERLKALSDVF